MSSSAATTSRQNLKKPCASFSNVDESSDPMSYLRYLDNAGASDWIQIKKRESFSALGVTAGSRILDVGCGTGDDVRTLAGIVGNNGLVVGLDSSKTMITAANARLRGLKISAKYILGDAHQLNLTDDIFDICRCERVFQHLKHPQKALSEMFRVIRPGGRIVVTETDWETLVIGCGKNNFTSDAIGMIRRTIRNPGIGHHLPILFEEAGLSEISATADTLMLRDFYMAKQLLALDKVMKFREISKTALEKFKRWLEFLEKCSKQDRFFCALTGFHVVGRKLEQGV